MRAQIVAPPLALYAHFPWCVQKCPYCDFNSYTLRDALPEQRYVDALRQDLDAQAPLAEGRRLISIFMGGGTPSLFSPSAIGHFIDHARERIGFLPDIEITLEANPGTIERGRFAEYKAVGVTRVSLGAQSFDDQQLKVLGRIHSATETRRAAEELHAAGLSNFNLDLMYALPGQSPEAAVADLDEALALEPAHLSQYHLTIEPGTLFAASPPIQPEDEAVEEMLSRSLELLRGKGLEQYEVSAYARPGRRCVHNLNYWSFGDYLGVGAGAHGKVTLTEGGRIVRTQQWREPRRYLGGGPDSLVRKSVDIQDLPFEFAMNGLRLVEGFTERQFEERTGETAAILAPAFARPMSRGLLLHEAGRWRATPVGWRFLNEILVDLLPDGRSPEARSMSL